MIERLSGQVELVAERSFQGMGLGQAPGGPQDRFTSAALNALLGNELRAPVLESLLGPWKLRIQRDCLLMVGGAPGELKLGTLRKNLWESIWAREGEVLSFRPGAQGCRWYIAVAGELWAEGDGSFGGSTRGDAERFVGSSREGLPFDLRAWEPPLGEIRILPGPEAEALSEPQLLAAPWEVSPKSGGMGIRLEGPELTLSPSEILSAPTQDGLIQASTGGLIALMRHRGTVGGYPRVASVIDPDIDRLAQLRPGDQVRFQELSLPQALEVNRLQQEALQRLQSFQQGERSS